MSTPDHLLLNKPGSTSTADAAYSGCPIEVSSEEMVDKSHCIVMEDRRTKLREIAEIVEISCKQVHIILHEAPKMKKLIQRWGPRF